MVIGYTSTAAVRNLSITGPHIGVALAFGEAEIESVAISGASYVALAVQEEARLGAREMVVRDTQRLDEGGGYGIQVLLGSVLEIERGEIVRSGYEGIRVGEGSEVHAMRLSVRDSGTAQEHVGAGVDASDGALVELSEAAIEGSAQMGIRAGAGTNISCHDGMIRGNQGLAEGHGAVTLDGALAAVDGARAEFTRVVVEGNTGLVGFSVKQGASLSATDLVVRDSRGAEGGGGVEVLGHADFERAVLARVRHIALGAWSTDSTVYADDLTITRTLADSSGLVGYGLQVSNGASLIVHRADVSANRVVGVLVADRGHLSGSDIRIVDTLPLERDGTHGAGIAIYGSDVELSRVEIERNHQLGIEVWAPSDGERGTVALEDLVVDVTLEQACSEGACAASPGGIAITVRNGALELNRFRLSNAALCGLQVLPDADVDLHQGVVSNNPIGVNMQSEGYDLARLQDGVLYRDNERNFDSQNLPIPEPLDPLEPPDP